MTGKKTDSDSGSEDRDSSSGLMGALRTVGHVVASPFMVASDGGGEEPVVTSAAHGSVRPSAAPVIPAHVAIANPALVASAAPQLDEAVYTKFSQMYDTIIRGSGETAARFLKLMTKLSAKYPDNQAKCLQTALDTLEVDDQLPALTIDMQKAMRSLQQEEQKANVSHENATAQVTQNLGALGARYATQQQEIQAEIVQLEVQLEAKRGELNALPGQQTQEEQALHQSAAENEVKFATIQAALQSAMNMVKTVGERK